jgi:hypothetical protein
LGSRIDPGMGAIVPKIDLEIDSGIGSGIGTRPSYPELGGISGDATQLGGGSGQLGSVPGLPT